MALAFKWIAVPAICHRVRAVRWERDTAAKLVTKLLAGDQSLQSMPSLPGAMSRALSKALGNLPEHLQGGVHPEHVLLEMNEDTKSHIVGMSNHI